jgi:hypothetical protein
MGGLVQMHLPLLRKNCSRSSSRNPMAPLLLLIPSGLTNNRYAFQDIMALFIINIHRLQGEDDPKHKKPRYGKEVGGADSSIVQNPEDSAKTDGLAKKVS